MEFVSVLLIAAAISIDAFGVAIVYGIRKIQLPINKILLLSLSTSIILLLSILCGKVLSPYLTPGIERVISGSILLCIGFIQLFNGWKAKRIQHITKDTGNVNQPIKLFTIKIKTLGIILDIMTDPTKADLDHSKNISIKEALLLSLALNMDAFGAGLSVGLMGFSFLLVPLSAFTLILVMMFGLHLGKKYLSKFNEDNGYFFTGFILVMIAVNNFI